MSSLSFLGTPRVLGTKIFAEKFMETGPAYFQSYVIVLVGTGSLAFLGYVEYVEFIHPHQPRCVTLRIVGLNDPRGDVSPGHQAQRDQHHRDRGWSCQTKSTLKHWRSWMGRIWYATYYIQMIYILYMQLGMRKNTQAISWLVRMQKRFLLSLLGYDGFVYISSAGLVLFVLNVFFHWHIARFLSLRVWKPRCEIMCLQICGWQGMLQ